MPFSDFQREVAAVALKVAAAHGFVLGGGNALILHGIVDRYTADVDLVTDRPTGVKAAAATVEEALRAAGFQAERQDLDSGLGEIFYGFDQGLAEWIITGPGGEQTVLQITHFDRNRAPVSMDVGPVLNPLDAIASKVRAFVTRAEERDVIDVAAALERYTVDQLIDLARQLEPGLQDEDFSDAGRRLDRLSDTVFRRYGFGPEDVARLRERFATWPRSLYRTRTRHDSVAGDTPGVLWSVVRENSRRVRKDKPQRQLRSVPRDKNGAPHSGERISEPIQPDHVRRRFARPSANADPKLLVSRS